MERVTYLNEYAKNFELVKNRELFDERDAERMNRRFNTKDIYTPNIGGENTYVSTSRLKEKKSFKKFHLYNDDSKDECQVRKIRNTNEYVILSNSPKKPKKSTIDEKKDMYHNFNNDIKPNKKSNYQTICICKKCYIKDMQEKLRERKKRTTVYTLEFNNFVNNENIYKEIISRSIKRTRYNNYLNKNKDNNKNDNLNMNESDSFKNDIMLNHIYEHSENKKNIFHFLNNIFKIN